MDYSLGGLEEEVESERIVWVLDHNADLARALPRFFLSFGERENKYWYEDEQVLVSDFLDEHGTERIDGEGTTLPIEAVIAYQGLQLSRQFDYFLNETAHMLAACDYHRNGDLTLIRQWVELPPNQRLKTIAVEDSRYNAFVNLQKERVSDYRLGLAQIRVREGASLISELETLRGTAHDESDAPPTLKMPFLDYGQPTRREGPNFRLGSINKPKKGKPILKLPIPQPPYD